MNKWERIDKLCIEISNELALSATQKTKITPNKERQTKDCVNKLVCPNSEIETRIPDVTRFRSRLSETKYRSCVGSLRGLYRPPALIFKKMVKFRLVGNPRSQLRFARNVHKVRQIPTLRPWLLSSLLFSVEVLAEGRHPSSRWLTFTYQSVQHIKYKLN